MFLKLHTRIAFYVIIMKFLDRSIYCLTGLI